jgi:molecular chaperone IbpA
MTPYEVMKKKSTYPDYAHKMETPKDPFTTLEPFLNSWTIGFDRHFQLLEELRNASKSTYPPYNIVQVDDGETYIIEIAAAGFTKEDIEVSFRENQLIVTGKMEDDSAQYLHKGIASRDFEQSFALADDVRVVDASMQDGILSIRLEREIPEHKKPRTITIK